MPRYCVVDGVGRLFYIHYRFGGVSAEINVMNPKSPAGRRLSAKPYYSIIKVWFGEN
jgi:hypothetical protein